MKNISILTKVIGENSPVFIIAEAGVNHNGDIKLAKKLVDAAKQAGADAVKFQIFKTEELVTKTAKQANYQRKNDFANSQYEMLKKLELTLEQFKSIFDYCNKRKILFMATASDLSSVEYLSQLGVLAFKVGSGDLTNLPLVRKIATYGLPVILSTGMAYIKEVKEAVAAIYKTGNKKLILMHCTTDYPAKNEDINLRAMVTLRNYFRVPTGFSDHSEGIELSLAACALDACVIEKHFTLSRKLKGPDHQASIEPSELAKMIKSIRRVEIALGSGEKKPTKIEMNNRQIVWRSLVAADDLAVGHKMDRRDIGFKRPGTGILPKDVNKIIGKRVIKKIKKDQLIKWDHLQK